MCYPWFQAVKEHSSSLSGLVVPLIRESLAPQVTKLTNSHPILMMISMIDLFQVIVHLDVDGLTLWLSALRNAVTIASANGDSALQDIFPQALALLSTNLDLLGSITQIIESYFLLDASYILEVDSLISLHPEPTITNIDVPRCMQLTSSEPF